MQPAADLSWNAIEEFVARSIADSSEPFAEAIVKNMQDLFSACRGRCLVPAGATKGYWPTICVSWNKVEVEVFEDRYELYRFIGDRTEVEYFEHAPGREVPSSLLVQLPCRKIEA